MENIENIEKIEAYLTVQEFCDLLKIGQSTAYRMIKAGQIPAIRFGRRYKVPRSVFKTLK